MKAIALKLSELPDDIEICSQYSNTTYTVAELKREILELQEPHHETKAWAVISRKKWYPSAERMVEMYIDNEADDLYEDVDETINGSITEEKIDSIQAILDSCFPSGLDYWIYGKDVEIDIFPPVEDGEVIEQCK